MATACVLCNTLVFIEPACHCGGILQDQGPVTDYIGAYSPYYHTSFEQPYCRHLFSCPHCGHDQIITAPLNTF